jgi:predicted DNA-binding protein
MLARGFLDQVEDRRLAAIEGASEKSAYREKIGALKAEFDNHYTAEQEIDAELTELVQKLNDQAGDVCAQRQILERIHAKDEENGDVLAGLAFYSAMDEAWEPALSYSRDFLKRSGRESASRLSIGLLEVEILMWMGRTEEMRERLKEFHERTRDPWYRALSAYFLEEAPAEASRQMSKARPLGALTRAAGDSPETLVTAHSALGFWSESLAQTEAAKRHYKEALGSYLDNWLEYELARERLRRLRKED